MDMDGVLGIRRMVTIFTIFITGIHGLIKTPIKVIRATRTPLLAIDQAEGRPQEM